MNRIWFALVPTLPKFVCRSCLKSTQMLNHCIRFCADFKFHPVLLQRPVFKEMISDDRMKGLVMECLRLQCEDNSQLRALLAVHRRKLDQVHSSHHEVKANAMDDGYILSRLAEIRNQEAKDQCGPALSQDAGLFTSLQRRHGPQAALRVDGPTAEAATTSEPRHV